MKINSATGDFFNTVSIYVGILNKTLGASRITCGFIGQSAKLQKGVGGRRVL